MIVKVQRYIGGNDPRHPWLIYDEKRKRMQAIPEDDVPQEIKDKLGGAIKAYFHADWNVVDKTFTLVRNAEAQPW